MSRNTERINQTLAAFPPVNDIPGRETALDMDDMNIALDALILKVLLQYEHFSIWSLG